MERRACGPSIKQTGTGASFSCKAKIPSQRKLRKKKREDKEKGWEAEILLSQNLHRTCWMDGWVGE